MMSTKEPEVCSRQEAILGWYQDAFPTVARYVNSRDGNLEDAKEIFQEAVVVYYEKSLTENFQPIISDAAYLVGIAKKLWLKSTDKTVEFHDLERFDIIEEKAPLLWTNKLLGYLKLSGERCMELLQAFYFEKISMHEMAVKFGYRTERSATVQKYKCLEKVRSEIKQKSLSYEDFFE